MKEVLYAEKLAEPYPVKSRIQQIIDTVSTIDRSCVNFSSFIEQMNKIFPDVYYYKVCQHSV